MSLNFMLLVPSALELSIIELSKDRLVNNKDHLQLDLQTEMNLNHHNPHTSTPQIYEAEN